MGGGAAEDELACGVGACRCRGLTPTHPCLRRAQSRGGNRWAEYSEEDEDEWEQLPREALVRQAERQHGQRGATAGSGDDGDSSASSQRPRDGEPGEALSSPRESEPGDMTCAICLHTIQLEDMAMVKGCDHMYCGEG